MTDLAARAARSVPWPTDLAIVAAAVVCPMVLWVSAVPVGGVDLAVAAAGGDRRVGGLAVALTAGGAATLGLVLLRWLERRTTRALGPWTVLALVVTVLSLAGPLGATTTEATGTLVALHAVVAAPVVVGAHRSRRSHH